MKLRPMSEAPRDGTSILVYTTLRDGSYLANLTMWWNNLPGFPKGCFTAFGYNSTGEDWLGWLPIPYPDEDPTP